MQMICLLFKTERMPMTTLPLSCALRSVLSDLRRHCQATTWTSRNFPSLPFPRLLAPRRSITNPNRALLPHASSTWTSTVPSPCSSYRGEGAKFTCTPSRMQNQSVVRLCSYQTSWCIKSIGRVRTRQASKLFSVVVCFYHRRIVNFCFITTWRRMLSRASSRSVVCVCFPLHSQDTKRWRAATCTFRLMENTAFW